MTYIHVMISFSEFGQRGASDDGCTKVSGAGLRTLCSTAVKRVSPFLTQPHNE